MANVILVQGGSVILPVPEPEGVIAVGAPTFPRIFYSAAAPTGRIFASQADLDGAGPGWVQSPADVAATLPPPEVEAPAEAASPPPPTRASRR